MFHFIAKSKIIVLIINFLLAFALLFSLSCEKRKHTNPLDPNYDGAGNPTMKQIVRTGILKLIPESTLQLDDLEVLTFAKSINLDQNGNFSVPANEADKYQSLFFNHKLTQSAVYLGLYNPVTNQVSANDTSTALALTLFNPYLIYTNQTQRQEYIQAVKQRAKFAQLLELIKNAHKADAKTALDYDTNPTIYQVACQLMKEAMESLGGLKGLYKTAGGNDSPPYIEDATGDAIRFVNPLGIWYAAGVYNDKNQLKQVVTVSMNQSDLTYNWSWPPSITRTPEKTSYNLGNGSFTLYLTKGGDFSKLDAWNDPTGRATICNTAQTLVYLMELAIGNNNYFKDELMVKFSQIFQLTASEAFSLSEAIASKDIEQFLINFSACMTNNYQGAANWMWGETTSNAPKQYLKNTITILKNVALVFKLLGIMNDQAPFFGDLVFGPKDVTYAITQTNGKITETEQNDPPAAKFTVSPPAGVVGTLFTFNAATSTDDHDNLAALQFRWDWETDGTWDTNWKTSSSATHSYTEAGAYSVTLEVKDSKGLIGSIVRNVNVGGGAGTADHVKLFRDNLPWSNNAMVEMLESLGFTEGVGPNTYEIIPSSQMATEPLEPGKDLVIISNDQNQTFYNNYAASQVRFTNFVYTGGSMFWEACDEGWASGSIVNAGIVLPGNISTTFDYDYWNYITDPNLPLVAGLPTSMDHNYASHESFSNLPDGTTVYCVDESNNPTLIEFNLGGGWIIISGQPLEHQYKTVYGAADMEKLLPRIVSYFTGKALPKSMPKPILQQSTRPSHE